MKQIIIFLFFLGYFSNDSISEIISKENSFSLESNALVFNCNPESDSLQLVSFYNQTGGPNWINQWDLSEPMSTWYGLSFNSEGCVSCIDLDGDSGCSTIGIEGNNLTGNLIDMDLPFLEYFYCSNNNLIGSIPNFDGIPNLTYFDCRMNQLTGSIPDFSNFIFLEKIHCDSNQLSGPIPDFTNLPSLRRLYCQNNELSDTIPDFSNLPNLELFYCNYNNLTGSISDFSNLPSLREFNCSWNQLTGTIPDFTNMPDLEIFYCQNNELIGTIPDFINIPNLEIFHCNYNNLIGAIPNFTNLPELYQFNCSWNHLIGEIPDFENVPKLAFLHLGRNNLVGEVPDFSSFSDMYFLHVGRNYLGFGDLFPAFVNNNDNIDSFSYARQDMLLGMDSLVYNIQEGDSLRLVLPSILTELEGSRYIWYDTEDSIVYDTILGGDGSLGLFDMTLEDGGTYICFVDNLMMPDLNFLYEKITVNVNPCPLPNTDSLCFEIIPNQLIVDLSSNDSLADCDSMRMALIDYLETDSNNIYEYRIDYCNCDCFAKVTFESDSIVDLIGIHERKKGMQKELDVDTEYEYLTNEPFDASHNSSSSYSVLGNPPLGEEDYTTVYIIDSGINLEHSGFSENAFVQNNGIEECEETPYYYLSSIIGYDHFFNMSEDSLSTQIFQDTHGHGTHVAGNILNQSSGASKLAFGRIISNNGSGSKFGWICAMYDATNYNLAIENHNNQGGVPILDKDKIRISNISLGWQGDSAGNKMAEKAIVAAEEAGILIVASAGNEADDLNENPNVYPVCFDSPNIIGVAAVESDNSLASFSNAGVDYVDIAALGVNVKGPTLNNDIGFKSGTSQAVSLVAGELAYLAAKHPNLDNVDLVQMLYDNADIVEELYPFVDAGRVLNTIIELPVELVEFSVKLNDENHVLLDWQTALEINNSHFIIERMSNEMKWEQLGEVKGQGNSVEYQDYQYWDLKPVMGLNYYRLKQVDYDGLYQYSDVKIISLSEKTAFTINPNPVGDELHIKMNSLIKDTWARLRVVNSFGNFVDNMEVSITEGFNSWTLDMSHFPKGVYIITLEYENGIITKKIIKR